MKIDEDGNEVWSETCGGEDWDLGHAIQPTIDGGYIIAGYTQSFGAGANDLWLLKIAGETSAIEDIVATPSIINLHENYPNPFNSSTTIRYRLETIRYRLESPGFVIIDIFDLLGRKIKTLVNGSQTPGDYRVAWNAEDNPSGVYFYRLQAGEVVETKRMVLLK
jgi:hypothetical protein